MEIQAQEWRELEESKAWRAYQSRVHARIAEELKRPPTKDPNEAFYRQAFLGGLKESIEIFESLKRGRTSPETGARKGETTE